MENEKQHIGQLFDRIAGTYDRLNHLLSLNIDKHWRRKGVKMLSNQLATQGAAMSCDRLLDVAIGTADLTLEILRQDCAYHVTGIDLSKKMMAIGEQKVAKAGYASRVKFDYGSAQDMPYGDGVYDAVTCAYGVRNFADMDAGLREMYRVLKPGGKVMILEFSYPTTPFIRWGYDLYFTHILPGVGNLLSRDKGAYSYLNRSVKHFPYGEAFLEHMHAACFTDTRAISLTFGISTVYLGTKE